MNDDLIEQKLSSKKHAICPVEMQVGSFYQKQLAPSDQIMMQMHIAQCPHCKNSLNKLEAKNRPVAINKKNSPFTLMGNGVTFPHSAAIPRMTSYPLLAMLFFALFLLVSPYHSRYTSSPTPTAIAQQISTSLQKIFKEPDSCSTLPNSVDYLLAQTVKIEICYD